MDKRFFNIFAKIYLYINEFSIIKNLLQIQTYNIEEKYQKLKTKDITEIEDKVDEIINNKLSDSENMQYLYDILLVVDYVY